ncbi:hypothetical protein [Methyloceanibacter sp.]|uniref:hypothetical protein n=1 Tax=Methyloceanibacter sp. TaxID=1965321 RepID=UPI002C5828BF|nr:hypothetical protein [Methyloceanibacter sp.]HML91090.1 hypothetical protein [Methyloceanibacter sp.]
MRRTKEITPQAQVLLMISKLPEDEQYEVIERAQRILRHREEATRRRAPRNHRCSGRIQVVPVEEFA